MSVTICWWYIPVALEILGIFLWATGGSSGHFGLPDGRRIAGAVLAFLGLFAFVVMALARML